VGTFAVFEIEESTHFCAPTGCSTCSPRRDVVRAVVKYSGRLLGGTVPPGIAAWFTSSR